MRISRRAGIIAIVGVLLHALALVRHHAVMMADALPYGESGLRVAAAFPYDLQLCRGNVAALPDGVASGGPGKQDPAPPHRPLPCPVCSGSASAYALAPSLVAFLVPEEGAVLESAQPADRPRDPEPPALPRARAPPTSA